MTTRVVIVGGGPGGYEAALVADQLGGEVTLVERDGMGGAAVLTDVVPSKTLIATAEVMTTMETSAELGLRMGSGAGKKSVVSEVEVDLAVVNERVRTLAAAQSADIKERLNSEGVRVISGTARLDGPQSVVAQTESGMEHLRADVVLIATGATPRELPSAKCDGVRILNWKQLYDLTELPKKLIVVGSGVTGAEFASAYSALGSEVVLVSSQNQVLPGQDADAARVLHDVFVRRGMTIMGECRAESAEVRGDEVVVTMEDGRTVTGTHCLMAVGAIPNTIGLGLAEAGVDVNERGYIQVDRVSRTTARGVYAAGDCTGVLQLASVAAMQGRIAMWHALGDAVDPLTLRTVSSSVFTAPEIATVGMTQAQVEASPVKVETVVLPLKSNARAKMQGVHDGFVKLFALPYTGIVVGGVVVAPHASELIHPIAVAVTERLTVDNFSHVFTVYPSMSGSVAEAARRLHHSNADAPF